MNIKGAPYKTIDICQIDRNFPGYDIWTIYFFHRKATADQSQYFLFFSSLYEVKCMQTWGNWYL